MTTGAWLALFNACHVPGMGGPQRVSWPDGRATLRQPAVTVQMFGVIAEEMMKEEKPSDSGQ